MKPFCNYPALLLQATLTLWSTTILQASAVPTPFSPVKGTYTGLFSDSGGAGQATSGYFVLTVTSGGAFSGSLQTADARYALRGLFGADGWACIRIPRWRLARLVVELQLDLLNGTDQVTGTVSDGTWTAQLLGNRATFDGKDNTPLQQGQYTLVIPGNDTSAVEPAGDSYGSLTVDKAGHIRFSASLADGTKILRSGFLSKEGQWPLYSGLYGGRGSIWSWLTLAETSASSLSGELSWLKPPTRAKCYPDGFNLGRTVWGSRYEQAAGPAMLGYTNAILLLSGAPLGNGILCFFTIRPNSRVSSTSRLSLAFTLSNGRFRGSVVEPGTSKAHTFSGVLLQRQCTGRGCFVSGSQSGQVVIEPAPEP